MIEPEAVRLIGQGGDELHGRVWRGAGSEARATVLLVHDAFGIDAETLDTATHLAREGCVVLSVDLFSREGAPAAAERTAAAALAIQRATPDRRVLSDLEAALAWLARDPDVDARRIGLVGFGVGGTWAFQAGCASSWPAAVVAVRPRVVHAELDRNTPLQPLEMALNLSVPFLGLFFADDPTTPPGDIERLRRVLSQFARDFELEVLPGVGGPLDARAPATEAVWRRIEAFLAARS